jgi:hypothetical protein
MDQPKGPGSCIPLEEKKADSNVDRSPTLGYVFAGAAAQA